MTKRGQVTAFVIIGLIIVALSIGIFLTRDKFFSGILIPKSISVPEQAESVKNFIQSCFDEALKNAVQIIAAQGGYITLPEDPINVGLFTSHLPIYGNNKVAYWYYKSDNNIEFFQAPSTTTMENEISQYIDSNLIGCLGSFNEFNEFKIQKGAIKTVTDIKNDQVISRIEFPVKIQKTDFDFTFKEFYSTYDAPLGDLYTVAKRIYDEENENFFLEKKTLDMMSVYEEVPLVGETSDCIATIWTKEEVKNNLKRILAENMPHFRIKGTDYTLSAENQKFFEIEAGVEDKTLTTTFLFSESWPFELNAFPEEDGLLKGQSVTESLGEVRGIAESFFCLSTFEFIYDVKYPVLIILNKNDFTFQFAIMPVVDRNKPRLNTDEFLVFEPYDSRFCNEQTQFTVFTVDTNFNDLEDVDVKYKCINHLCDLGISQSGEWRGKAPLCFNGEFIGEKQNYHLAKSQITTLREGSAFLILEPLRTVNVEILVQRAGSGELDPGEKVYITLEEEDKEFNRFILYPDQQTVELIPGNYKAKIYLISPQEVKIEEKTIENCAEVPAGIFGGLFGITEEKCEPVTIPGTTADQITTGTQEFSFIISEDNLRYNTIVFYAPYHGIINDITELSNLTEQEAILPEFK